MKLSTLNFDFEIYSSFNPQPWGSFYCQRTLCGSLLFPAHTLSHLLSPSLSPVLGILGLGFWNLGRKWVTQQEIKQAWRGYLPYIINTPLMRAKSNSRGIISHSSPGLVGAQQEESLCCLLRPWKSSGGCPQIV